MQIASNDVANDGQAIQVGIAAACGPHLSTDVGLPKRLKVTDLASTLSMRAKALVDRKLRDNAAMATLCGASFGLNTCDVQKAPQNAPWPKLALEFLCFHAAKPSMQCTLNWYVQWIM